MTTGLFIWGVLVGLVVSGVLSTLLRPRCKHVWSKWTKPYTVRVPARKDEDGTDLPPFWFEEQDRTCHMCGSIQRKRLH